MRKSIPLVALGLSAALVLSACGGGTAKSADKHAADNAAAPDTITAAIGYDGDNYDGELAHGGRADRAEPGYPRS